MHLSFTSQQRPPLSSLSGINPWLPLVSEEMASGGQISTKHLTYPVTLSFGGAIDPGTLFWGRTGNDR
jgi:hypothetical protein